MEHFPEKELRDRVLGLTGHETTFGNMVENEQYDDVSNPRHYVNHPSGVECIEITEWMNFCVGNAVKYLFRCDEKGDPIENLEKAKWYIEREIGRRSE